MPGATILKMADLLKSKVGLREGPRNNETEFGRWYPMNFQPWCAIFLSWGSHYAGATYLGRPWKFASTVAARDHARKHGRWTTTPTVGTVSMMAHSATTGHVGFVIGIDKNGNVVTVEGNTNSQGGREGNGVWLRTRARSEWDGYIVFDETHGKASENPPTPPVRYGLLNHPVVGAINHFGGNPLSRPTGYVFAAADGGVFAFGSASYHGSLGGVSLSKPVVGIAGHPSGEGYWLAASDGGIFAFGRAGFHGSLPPIKLAKPIVGIAATATGNGYWLAGADGGVFAFGDARFLGAVNQAPLAAPVVAIDATRSGNGYWLTAADGGVFAIGDAVYYGGATKTGKKIVGMTATPSEKGYWLISDDGSFYAYGDAPQWDKPAPMQYKTVAIIADEKGGAVIGQDGAVHGAGPSPIFYGSVYDHKK